MTRTEALLKLLAIEPATESQLLLQTGWPTDETRATLAQLLAAGQATHVNAVGFRWYRVEPHASPFPRHVPAYSFAGHSSHGVTAA